MAAATAASEGFEAPVHRALTEPILLAGAPRSIAIVNGTLAAALGLGLQLWIAGLPLWAVGHSLAVLAAKRDPDFAPVARPPPSPEGASSHAEPCRISPPRRPARRPSALGGAGRAGRRPQQGRQLPAHLALPRTRSRKRDRGRAGRRLRARVNNVLKRFGSGWALFFEAERREAPGYPDSQLSRPGLVAGRRGAAGELRGRARPFREPLPSDPGLAAAGRRRGARRAGAGRAAPTPRSGATGARRSAAFVADTDRALDLLSGFMPEVRALDDGETLTFLHDAISAARHRGRGPGDARSISTHCWPTRRSPAGSSRCSATCICGRLRSSAFPALSRPGILDALNHQDFGYRWVTRFIALDKADATSALTRLRRQWFNKRKSVTALLREVMYNQPVQLLDSDADNKVVDADLALQALGGDHVAFGYLTATVTVADADPRGRRREGPRGGAGRQRARLHRACASGINAVEAWLSSLPGPGLRQCPPAARPHAQPRASDALVVGLGGAGAQRASRRAAVAVRRDRRLDPVSPVDPCRRRRPHAGRRPDRRRQIGAARAACAAVPPLSGRAQSSSSTRAGRRAPRCLRWAARIMSSAPAGKAPSRRLPSSRCAGSTRRRRAAGRPNGSPACSRMRRSRSRPRSRRRSGRRF